MNFTKKTKKMKKVEDIKRPLIKGELFLVSCIVREDVDKIYITPVFNFPHSDRENGQSEIHYHADFRFLKHDKKGLFPKIENKHSNHIFCEKIRPEKKKDGKIEYFILPVINETFEGVTEMRFISKSKLKHKCIYKGKCPHRGYDLSQVKPVDGVITCPLHGLKFNSINNLIIK